MRPDDLRHVYWIGGASGAGKSTVACRVAARYGLGVYSTDDAMQDHAHRVPPDEAPFLAEFLAMDMDQRWVLRSPEIMLDTFHWYLGEGFAPIVADLLARPLLCPTQPGVIAEGFRLLPRLVRPLLADPQRAVWLLPTPDFRRAAFESRGSLWRIANKTSDPQRALRNLLERDRLFTDQLRAEASDLGLRVIDVDTTITEDDLTAAVASSLGL